MRLSLWCIHQSIHLLDHIPGVIPVPTAAADSRRNVLKDEVLPASVAVNSHKLLLQLILTATKLALIGWAIHGLLRYP